MLIEFSAHTEWIWVEKRVYHLEGISRGRLAGQIVFNIEQVIVVDWSLQEFGAILLALISKLLLSGHSLILGCGDSNIREHSK